MAVVGADLDISWRYTPLVTKLPATISAYFARLDGQGGTLQYDIPIFLDLPADETNGTTVVSSLIRSYLGYALIERWTISNEDWNQ